MTKISLYICASSDGFIADKSGGVSWLPQMDPEAQQNYESYFASIDLVLMGSQSYKKVQSFSKGMDWPYSPKLSYVFTKQDLKSEREDIKMTNEDPTTFLERIQGQTDPEIKKVWLMGGAALTKSFAEANLIDEILLFTCNKKIGEGIELGVDLDGFEKVGNEEKVGELMFQEYRKKN